MLSLLFHAHIIASEPRRPISPVSTRSLRQPRPLHRLPSVQSTNMRLSKNTGNGERLCRMSFGSRLALRRLQQPPRLSAGQLQRPCVHNECGSIFLYFYTRRNLEFEKTVMHGTKLIFYFDAADIRGFWDMT